VALLDCVTLNFGGKSHVGFFCKACLAWIDLLGSSVLRILLWLSLFFERSTTSFNLVLFPFFFWDKSGLYQAGYL
jgi:hypothetical protein